MSEVTEALLDAGAVLPVGTDAVKDTIDTLTTRAYAHPVLGERRVVRLVAGTLGPAEDLTMEFLGFTAPETVAEVGVVRQQALGFPAWALVHDPANGHHALALVKDIERLVRTAKSRIGPARDGFNELGERLARSVPHFLPTFYEEAARAFLAADSPTYAATMFGKAREAERLYALAIDEDRQHTVFLEFALAGALTAKALAAHSRDLAGRCAPAVAYDRFRRLCLERTLGGMPPYAQMHVDLGRLAKAAGLAADEEDALLTELLAAPSIVRAPGGFWKAYRPVLVRIARRDPLIRGQLLGMFPPDCPFSTWLEILEECGAVAALTDPAVSVADGAASPDGPAGWLVRADQRRGGWRRARDVGFYRLAERMAPRLKADGVPVELCRGRHQVDLDLVDTVLALGVPLAEVHEDARCEVGNWLNDEAEGRRELSEVAADERLRAAIADSIEEHLRPGYREEAAVAPEQVAAVVAVPGLRTALHWWLDRLAERVAEQGLTTVGDELDRLTLVACPAGLAVNPEAIARITAHDLGPILARTLRAGVLDEFGWPALHDAAVAVTGGERAVLHDDLQVVPQWPALVVRRGDQVAVAGADGVELEHTLRIPRDERRYMWRTVLRHVDGQLLVSWDRGQERGGYWSGTPDDVFTSSDDGFSTRGDQSVALPGGGRTAGGRPLHVGDRDAQDHGAVSTDGLHHWVLLQNSNDYNWRWREYDVATGALGRESLPAFFEEGAVDGEPLQPSDCRLRPATPGMVHSPLGHRDGLVGWRLRRTPEGQTGEGVDGRTFTLLHRGHGRRARQGTLVGAIRFPGSDTLHGIVLGQAWRDNTLTLCTADGLRFASVKAAGEHNAFAEGSWLVPPPAFWHHLRPRDEAGSAALRALPDELAGRLLTAVSALAGAGRDRAEFDDAAVRAAVRGELPQVSDAALLAGVAGVVKHATRAALRLERLTTAAAAIAEQPVEVTADPDADKPSDRLLDAALSGLIPGCYDHGHEAVKLYIDLAAALTGREPRRPIDGLAAAADVDWFDALGVVPAIMLRSVSPVGQAEHRTALVDLLEIIAASGLLSGSGRTRRVALKSDTELPVLEPGQVLDLGGGRRLLAMRVDRSDGDVTALEHSTEGRFGPVPAHSVQSERVFPRHVDADAVTRFVAAAREHGPAAVLTRPETVRAVSAAVGISLAEATVLLAGGTDLKRWERDRPDGWEPAGAAVTDAAIEAALEQLRWRASLSPASGVHAVLLPDDAAALWTGGPDTARLAAWRAERVGARTPVGDELITEFRRAGVPTGLTASEFLHGVANAETCHWLHGPVDGVDADDLLVTVARAVPWLVRRLPAGDPVRDRLPRTLELVRQRALDPAFELQIGAADDEDLEKFLPALGLPLTRDEHRIDAGLFVVPLERYWRRVMLRPSRLEGPDDPHLKALVAFLGDPDRSVVALRAILGDQLTGWLADEPVEAPHDPSRSAPQLVAQVAERHGIGADAATLYLQLLALPDPTDRNVAGWTGWKPARLKAARAELAGTDLVVEAKRPRAGRSLFLPGGWLALGTPHLPLERWKLPLLIGDGDDVHALGTVIPVAPAPRLFTLAWDRVAAGDHPRFEELTTRGRR
jgi:hypothetical protein